MEHNSKLSVYMSDDMYTPIQYKGHIAEEPSFLGKGIYSVKQLEEICEQYKEYVHQQQVIKRNCMLQIVDLKETFEDLKSI